MVTLVADIETDGLLNDFTRIWCMAIGELEGEPVAYADQPGYSPLSEGLARLKAADKVVFHNGLGFDIHVINDLYPGTLLPEQIVDTLVISRLLKPARTGGHSLEMWGQTLGFAKGKWDDWSKFDPDMVVYNLQDIRVTQRLYAFLMKHCEGWGASVLLEHEVAWVIGLQVKHGFKLNIEKCHEVVAELRQEKNDLLVVLQEIFPPIIHKRVSAKTGKDLKDGIEVFNPGSRQQIVSRLGAKYGWKPIKYTEKGTPQVDEEVLVTLKYPEAKKLSRWFEVDKQLGQISDGKAGWLKLEVKGRVYGSVNSNGCITSRMSHYSPNLANVNKEPRMREVFEPDEGDILVGVDASSLELCMLAHYLAWYDFGSYARTVVLGCKEDGTDPHTVTMNAAGMHSRNNAKTLIYAYLYGAGDLKLGQIIIDDMDQAKVVHKVYEEGGIRAIGKSARKALLKGIVGLDKLNDSVKDKHITQGWVRGLDGRKIETRSEHSALNTLLQGAGAIVMKKALSIFHNVLLPGLNLSVKYCANVHDEVQMSVHPDNAELVGKTFIKAIVLAGEAFKMRCPLNGKAKIGTSWRATH